MKTLTIQEASRSLGDWLRRAVKGEQIAINEGTCAVLLQPLPAPPESPAPERVSPREALRLMQEESRLTPEQAEQYMREVCEERLAAEARRPA
jgi:antitoxin (DNA-binding transcriptional repressor) of toxin-antitoxin stability system